LYFFIIRELFLEGTSKSSTAFFTVWEFWILTPPIAVTPTTAMMQVTAVTPEEFGTPAAAHEFCGDSQKNLWNGKNSFHFDSV
jgi:hypothetical protein